MKVQENTAIEKTFNLEIREQLHTEIVKMFYSASLPFHLTRNILCEAFSYAANNYMSGYSTLGYNMLITTLTQIERANV